uniref:RING-type domain-containing protein n=1 Tax=Lotus japonicus TaxID=34305 RepID=I3T767_LOTJA|nr:unknown [Lotus japonicus]
MNCLVGCQSQLWVVTIVFYTCILIPLKELKGALASLFGLFSKDVVEFLAVISSLPVARFEDLRRQCCCEGGDDDELREKICSICLVEFEGEDAVSKLERRGHVFHLNCIEQWLDRCQFSCPLCRSFLFSQHHVYTTK